MIIPLYVIIKLFIELLVNLSRFVLYYVYERQKHLCETIEAVKKAKKNDSKGTCRKAWNSTDNGGKL